MQVQLETLSNLERKMNISIPMKEIEDQVTERLKRTAKKAKIAGFRPGKAPLNVVEANYGIGIRSEVLNDTIHRHFYDALVQEKLRIAGRPSFEVTSNSDDKESFIFNATFEVYPEVSVGEFTSQKIEKPTLAVSDEDIEKTIEILRSQRTRYEYVERAAQDDDRIIIDFAGTIDGEPFAGGSSENMPLVLGKGQMLGEFEAGVRGMKESETKDVKVHFPEDYHGKEVAGKTAVFSITVKNVSEPVLPEVDAEFAKMLGIEDGDVDKMREEVRNNVEREVTRRLAAQTKDQVMQTILNVTQIDLPKALVHEEIHRLMEEMRQNLIQRGIQAQNMSLPEETFRQQAERRVALGLILAQLVSENDIKADPERVKALISEHAESYEEPDEVVQWYYADKQRLEGPTSMALEESIVDFVLSKAEVEEKPVTFDELMSSANNTQNQ